MKTLRIEYKFDRAARVYITSRSEVRGLNIWDKRLEDLIERVALSAPYLIRMNHPELLHHGLVDLRIENEGGDKHIIRTIALRLN